ncbi:hypothetical protein [Bifidobacterium callitrichos]|uniref:hypothetical protein n=1 Tax=Bifidobacterium callitrichos TaxID=762209 RepID=UPI0015E7824A|nr:hypothetical protein [Bifidobacterium callitrichos]
MADLTELARVGDRIQRCLPLNASNHENCVAWQKSVPFNANFTDFYVERHRRQ